MAKLIHNISLPTFVKKRILLIIFLIFYLSFSYITHKDYGLTMDEFFVYTRGEYFYNKVKGNDLLLQKGFVVKEKGNENLLYYNSTYAAFLYALNDSRSYENYHLINMLFASLIFIGLYELFLYIYGNQFIAFLAQLFLFFTPRSLGHIPANPKDIPFAVLYTISIIAIVLGKKISNNARIIITGLLFGITASLRLIGLSLLFIYIISYFDNLGWRNLFRLKSKIWELILEVVLIGFISFLVLIVSIPYLGADPFNHLIELIQVNKLYPWKGTVVFMNSVYSQDNIPAMYLPVWILISTPLFVLILSFVGLFKKQNSKAKIVKRIIVISLVSQILVYFVMTPVIYNGMRHYLFLLPHFVILAVIGFVSILREYKRVAPYTIAFLLLNIGAVLIFYFQYHPYSYTYFNELSRLITRIEDKFDFDYWGASDREALTWLRGYTEKLQIANPSIFLCSKSMSLPYYFPNAIDSNYDYRKAEFVVCYDQRQMKLITEKLKGKVIYEVKRNDKIFNTVYQVEGKR